LGRYSRKDKLKLAIRRYIESELKDYKETKELLENALTDVIERSPLPEEGSYINSRNNVSKPTERNAVLLLTNKRIQQMEKTVNAISKVLNMLDKEKYRFVELRWWECELTPIGIAKEMHMHEQTVYNWQRDIIKLIAVEMGLINAADLL